ncbi:4Fe-4S binding protein [Syntrophomonas curvata]
MYGKGLIKGLGITLKHHFGKKLTIQYPEQQPYLQERYRGHLYLEFEKCKVCGICVKTCPNGVLSLEDARDEVSKKRKLMSYTIDHQYCMFCNLCVEACTQNCLHFSHDFELSRYRREDIKTVYHRPPEMDLQQTATDLSAGPDDGSAGQEAQDRREKQLKALTAALDKNPQKLLAKYVDTEEQAEVLTRLLQADRNKAEKILAIMADDKDKARKVAQALVSKELKKDQAKTEGGNAE